MRAVVSVLLAALACRPDVSDPTNRSVRSMVPASATGVVAAFASA